MRFKLPDDYPGFLAPWGHHSPGWKMLPRWLKSLRFWMALFGFMLVLLAIRALFFWPYTVTSQSMMNTLIPGDVFLVNKSAYDFITDEGSPKPSDVIIFNHPVTDEIFVKRVIATGGQTVRIESKRVYVDDVEMPFPMNGIADFRHPLSTNFHEVGLYAPNSLNRDYFGPITVPDSMVFVLGDNRDSSFDSRFWGFVPESKILGKAEMILISVDPAKSWYRPVERYRVSRSLRWIL